jgi:hypothetical protein
MSWLRRRETVTSITIEIPDHLESTPHVRELRTHTTPVPVECSECGQSIAGGSYLVRWARTAEGLSSDGDECLCAECGDLDPDADDWEDESHRRSGHRLRYWTDSTRRAHPPPGPLTPTLT